ncbi:MAG: IS1595 family transposase [Gemmatimonadetes bacterium]|nr:IS1595 family transposase [Gemmatimonadota bacterium]
MTETKKAPGKHFRKGMTLVELIRKFPDDETAEAWIASIRWPDGPRCPHCDCDNVQHPTRHKTMPYRCRRNGCRKFFSVKVGTVMQDSKLGYQEWAIAVFLYNTNLTSVSSMKLHRDLGISQKSAWHLAHRLRECWDDSNGEPFAGPVEVDETYIGGKAKNMHARQRRERITGRGGTDKTAVVGIKDRASGRVAAAVVDRTDAATLQAFVADHAAAEAMVYTDEHGGYVGLPHHETVRHSVAEYVNGKAHTNGVESFWAALKRGYHGTFHHVSPEHLHRYVAEFAGRHSRRRLDTADMMAATVEGMEGKHLPYARLVA